MRQSSRLRSLRTLSNTEDGDPEPQETYRTAVIARTTEPSGKVNNSGGGGLTVEVSSVPSINTVRTTKRSLFLEHKNDVDGRGCVEAVSALMVAIVTAYLAADNKQDSKGAAIGAVDAEGASPVLLQTNKGAGTIECRNSARELLRFFGHSPLLHLEGVIWVKTSGERGDELDYVGSSTART